ncbi:restriction endonuclease subunit S [Winogradskyella forsetii]|uniref:restriction endonuclease subunit S n=1 Tax=Winogradskyella forsetii TaxID=2686077 RepID=UPI0015C064A7|nr:restriction endonuclease subunit S [Winogradskyella forsetii]
MKFSNFKILKFWDYYSFNNKSEIYSNYPLVELSDVLTQRKDSIKIDDTKLYKRCRVKVRGQGIVLRDEVLGKEIKTKKQYLCKEDDFLVAEIDAKVGGYGIVPKELINAIVSSHYFLFDIDEDKLNPEYLSILTKCEGFSKQVKATGSTNYAAIRPSHVLEYLIPLPRLKEQEKIINQYNKRIALSEKQINKAIQLEIEIENYLFEALGIKKAVDKINIKGLHLVSLSQLEKWGIDFIEDISNKSTLFDEYKINEISQISSGGTPLRSRKEYYSNGDIPWVKTGELENEIIYDSEEKITIEGLNNSSAKLYEKDSLIIAMYGATIGKTAKLGVSASTNQACAVLFNIDNDVVLTDFLWEYLQIQKDSFKKLAYGSAQPNLNAGIISNYKVPIPPIDKQKEITNHILNLKNKIKDLKTQSEKNRNLSITEFENEIFKPV